MSAKPLAVSVGDPAGIGPEVTVSALAGLHEEEAFVVFGDAARLEARFREAGVPTGPAEEAAAGKVGLAPTARWSDATIAAHAPTPEGGRAQLEALDAAIDAVRRGRARALVTGPTSKEAIVLGGTPFTGQTERLARRCGLGDDDVTMMFLGPRLKVGLVTTHLSVRDAAAAITPARVSRAVRHLLEALERLSEDGGPTIWVTGVNPHAGEGGLFGDEEERAVAPALAAWADDERVWGPIPAEAAFRAAAEGRVDGVVAMLHDQATIASKLLDWGAAVNVTWGLPFVRTSVDHGVAYDAARQGTASAAGMEAAVALARRLVPE
ncbi:MAG TPA: 4-hydroxythreonine-4-phosphate dehydrogenase PdxA [Polyangiaceae bacterium LLY-WYZ-15_(1-7)]|nr:4-hydroxythreonine-4-phosphate dehydrogenase PdxA [Myxococcales bacterium]MAT26392.1 4-hydroxythreonine-4-phosphate dehydrogenase PdxA [Sandaracinus sp.]HJL05207.1 4-hydroxythreonine-4-phosphate dehydrogenase PdxA [Polyangiaceae bacterium LLY-WYZ-15_(1-7)]HJL08234.1 4-hydroxythreonine-4-phosphate dehydrogenase PdxA [Polyangiaceae bacterium LLY-WYZ-15_(1-7)]HJL23477.1 4-hydroxythreonine-4-phosphate dehydrogenase PdxA [Polyangiaceae bacterium LLY-WYZ-15_(1-7)]